MVINGVSGTNAQIGPVGMSQANDPVAKDLQRQINEAQKQLQELVANKELSGEDKMKKRQELQQKINELNMQLRQHQIEKRQEKQKEKTSSDDVFDPNGQSNDGKAKTGEKSAGLSQASMEAMISADTSMKQSAVQGNVAAKMEGKAGVLNIEIKLDGARGLDVGKKQAELSKVEQKAEKAISSQLGTLAEANKTLQDAAKADRRDAETKKAEDDNMTGDENSDSEETQAAIYTPVDVRL